jgi:hypothetical protein
MNPSGAIQQQVQYLSWVISTGGWIIVALGAVVARLELIREELQRPDAERHKRLT